MNKCCLPFSMQRNWFPSGVLVGAVVVVKCLALSAQTVFVTCLLRSVWRCPALNTARNLRMASLRPSLFSLLQEQVGADKTPAKGRPWLGTYRREKPRLQKRGLRGLNSLEQACRAELGIGIVWLSNSRDLFAVLALLKVNKRSC